MKWRGSRRRDFKVVLLSLLALTGCAGRPPTPPAEIYSFSEFEKRLTTTKTNPKAKVKIKASKASVAKTPARSPASESSLPHLPYVVGESTVFTMKFIDVAAGEMTVETKPDTRVGDTEARHFQVRLSTNRVFSMFYRLDNTLDLLCDARTMAPLTVAMHSEENARLLEVRLLFDWDRLEATQWEKSVAKDASLSNRTKTWAIEPGAQSLFSAIHYLRSQRLEPGETVRFPIAHDERVIPFLAEVVAREEIDSGMGKVRALQLRTSRSLFSNLSKGSKDAKDDMLLWLSDDRQRLLVRAEIPLRFGRLTAILKSAHRP